MTDFATFWSGPLPAMVRACMASFPATGARLVVYAYEPPEGLPRGVAARDAGEICADLRGGYPVDGKPSLAHFSDRFRYEMLSRTDLCWVDADIVALRPERLDSAIVWGWQQPANGGALINNAVLRLPPADPVLAEMLARARAGEGQDLRWGALGPFLLTEIAQAHGRDASAAPPERYYPISFSDFWRLFDPDARDAVAEAVRDADLIHLWSELLRRCGFDFDAAPPPGSYLHELFADYGALALFARVGGADEIAAAVARWRTQT